MPEKPSFAFDYKRENVELVRQTCLYGVGPSRVALFQYGGPDADLQADVVGFAKELLTKCDRV
jgi:hypothetical protein